MLWVGAWSDKERGSGAGLLEQFFLRCGSLVMFLRGALDGSSATQLTVSGMGMQGPACFDARLGIHALAHMQSWSCHLHWKMMMAMLGGRNKTVVRRFCA